jgi:thiamine-phosphate pyrophosphorylase
MQLVVISPEGDDPREHAVLGELFATGLERYHVRKPRASATELETWIQRVPVLWRPRLVLHQHHELVSEFGLGGRHWKDEPNAPSSRMGRGLISRSCHDLPRLRTALGTYDSVFFGPVFASLSKPGYGPTNAQIGEDLSTILHTRTAAERRTAVLAIGGISVDTAPRALALGFDGVAVLGAVWQAADPVGAFRELQCALSDVAAGLSRAVDQTSAMGTSCSTSR